jgi:hypothetical protein
MEGGGVDEEDTIMRHMYNSNDVTPLRTLAHIPSSL